MPRKPLIRQSEFPYHVVARCHNKKWFPLPIDKMWKIYLEQLEFVQKQCKAQIIAFTLMSNHFHLIIKTPDENIDKIMYWIMKNSTLKVQKKSKIVNSLYGSRYKSTLLDSESYILNTYKYVLRNPLKAGLVQKIECYPFSISEFNNQSLLKLYKEDALKDFDTKELLKWINMSFSELEDKSMKVALARSRFKYMKNDNTKKLVVPSPPTRILEPVRVPKKRAIKDASLFCPRTLPYNRQRTRNTKGTSK